MLACFLETGDGLSDPLILDSGVWASFGQGIAVADFIRRQADLAINKYFRVSILLGKGDGTFAPGVLMGSATLGVWRPLKRRGIPDLAAVEPMGGNGGVCDPILPPAR